MAPNQDEATLIQHTRLGRGGETGCLTTKLKHINRASSVATNQLHQVTLGMCHTENIMATRRTWEMQEGNRHLETIQLQTQHQ